MTARGGRRRTVGRPESRRDHGEPQSGDPATRNLDRRRPSKSAWESAGTGGTLVGVPAGASWWPPLIN